jgi:phage tail sheath protein FI
VCSSDLLQYVFEQNTASVRARFVNQLTSELTLVQSQSGIEAFRVVMDETNNTAVDIEQNKLNGRILLVPTRAVEYIAIDFIITNAGVEFV